MFKFKRKQFFDHYRSIYGPLTQELVEALENLLHAVEADESWASGDTEMRRLAYSFATFRWETARTFRPIHEFGSTAYFNRRYGPNTAVGKRLGNTKEGDGARFAGRGFVQLTGRRNYQNAGEKLGIELEDNPDLAMQSDTAYKIAIAGMKQGWFTGKKFAHYIKDNGSAPDYVNARRIINGLDKADTIAAFARHFVEILRFSRD